MKKRRRRKSRYKRGTHESPKLTNGPAKYRSGWELAYMKWLDEDDDVVSYAYEPFHVSYVSNKKTGKLRKYFPDVFVQRAGSQQLIEIKPKSKLNKRLIIKKLKAGAAWAEDNNVQFLIITETELKSLNLI